MDESLLNYVIPSALTFVAGCLLKFVGPRARVVHWFPAYFGFQVPFTGAGGAQQVATVTTHALSIQNVGWRAARKLVGGRVPPARRKEIENELRRRVLEEFRATRIWEPKKRFYVVEERRGGANP